MQKPVSAAQTFQKLLLGLVALVVIIAALVGITRLFSGRSAANAAEPLIQLRAEHETQLTQQGPSPQAGETEMQTRFAPNWLNFESDGRLLFGCLRLPEGDGPHPVVVYCHGGFAMGASDIEEVDPLLKAGYAVFVPAWRGENGNAGNFEMFYGEVDDVIAAMEYLGRLPQIDENAISLVGHSAGATLALLAAECSDLPRTVIACSPVVDMTELVRLYGPEMYEEAPFDIEDTWETDLRSPIHFLDELKCPAHLYFGGQEQELIDLTENISQEVKEQPNSVRVDVINNTDHFTMLPKAIDISVAILNAVPRQMQGTGASKVDYTEYSRTRLSGPMEREPLATDASVKQWNSRPDPGLEPQDAYQFARWYRQETVPKEASMLDFYPESPGWAMSRNFKGDIQLMSLDGKQWHTLTGTIPNLLRTAQYTKFATAGVSSDGAHFAVRWQGRINAEARMQTWISIHEASDGKSVYAAENVDRCVCLSSGRVLFYHVDPASGRDQPRLTAISVVDVNTGETGCELPFVSEEKVYPTPGGKQLLVARAVEGGTQLRILSSEDGSELSSAEYPGVSLGDNIAITPDGKEAATVGDRRLTVFDLATGRVGLSQQVSDLHQLVDWLDDGRFLLLSQNVIVDRKTGKMVTTLRRRLDERQLYWVYGDWLVPRQLSPRFSPPVSIPTSTVRKISDTAPETVGRPNISVEVSGNQDSRLVRGAKNAFLARTGYQADAAAPVDSAVYISLDGEWAKDLPREQLPRLVLHGKDLPADIPRAGIMNIPQQRSMAISGMLLSPPMEKKVFQSTEISTGLLMESFETVQGDARFGDDVPFDVGLPRLDQTRLLCVVDGITKLDLPPTEEFHLKPGERQWLGLTSPKYEKVVENPPQTSQAWALNSPPILQQPGDDKVRAVRHETLRGEHGQVCCMGFGYRGDERVLLACLRGPCIQEFDLTGDSRQLMRVRNGSIVAAIQMSEDQRRWLIDDMTMLFVGDAATDTEPNQLVNMTQQLPQASLTSLGTFVVQLPTQRSKEKTIHVHRFETLLEKRGRLVEVPKPERVIAESAYAKYSVLPETDDLLAVEYKAIRRIDLATGKDVWRTELPETLTSLYDLRISPDGRFQVRCQQGKEKVLLPVNVASGELGVPEEATSLPRRIYSPDRSMYVTIFDKNYINICDASTDESLWKTEIGASNSELWINTDSSVAWSPDSCLIAVGCNGGESNDAHCGIDVWDVTELKPEP